MIAQGYPLWVASTKLKLFGRVIGWTDEPFFYPVVVWEHDNGLVRVVRPACTQDDDDSFMLMPGLVFCDTRDEAIAVMRS